MIAYQIYVDALLNTVVTRSKLGLEGDDLMDESSKFHTVRGYQRLDKQDQRLTSAMEDYLEMIYRSSLTDGYMRINTLSELLNVAAPSATKMVQNLSKIGLVDYKRYEMIVLTEKGREVGKYLLNRHNIIETFFSNLGVTDDLLAETELVEHDISSTTLQRFTMFNLFLAQNPEILKRYEEFMQAYIN